MTKNWYKSYERAEADASKYNCEIVIGGNGWTDIYYLVPKDAKPGIFRTIGRSQRDCNGRQYMYRVIYKHPNGMIDVIDKASKYRIGRVANGDIKDELVYDYLMGYYTLMEEKSPKIKERKENARMSHFLCYASGEAGHEERQRIRRVLRERGLAEWQ